uniref:Uncharacterized protein n=1 Tax=Janibacter limosus TaxID=53458 RepID=A0AC61U2K0_9MICO|nr:hypothetical protein [Janibacter limosus]
MRGSAPGEVVRGRGQPEPEAPDEHPERVPRAGDRASGRQRLLTAQCVGGEVAEPGPDLVDAEGGVGEVLPERVEQGRVGARGRRGGHDAEPSAGCTSRALPLRHPPTASP